MDGKGSWAELVAAAVAGRSLAEIAAAGGVSVSTAQRRLKDSDVVAEIREARSQQRNEAVGRGATLRAVALSRLAILIADDDPRVALRAVALALTASGRFDVIHDLDLRVAALEAPVDPDDGREEQGSAGRDEGEDGISSGGGRDVD